MSLYPCVLFWLMSTQFAPANKRTAALFLDCRTIQNHVLSAPDIGDLPTTRKNRSPESVRRTFAPLNSVEGLTVFPSIWAFRTSLASGLFINVATIAEGNGVGFRRSSGAPSSQNEVCCCTRGAAAVAWRAKKATEREMAMIAYFTTAPYAEDDVISRALA